MPPTAFKKGQTAWNKGKQLSEKHKRSLAKAHKGKRHSKEHKEKIGRGNTGKIFSEERRRKISEAKKGHRHTEESKRRMSESHKGKTLSEETKRKLSKALSGRTLSEEQIRKMSGENNGNWQGGLSFEPYGREFNKKLKEIIKKRDIFICQHPECNSNSSLVVHHIDYIKTNNHPTNLITLCRSHNARVNGNRNYWTEYFKNIVEKM